MVTNRKRNILFLLLWVLIPCVTWAQDDAFSLLRNMPRQQSTSISRKTLVRRHNPQVNYIGSNQFLLGEGNMCFHVDATALQTFMTEPQLQLNIGLNLPDTTRLTNLDMSLDRWTGKAESRFRYNDQYYHVETVCSPTYQYGWQTSRPTFSTRITSDSIFEVVIKPVPFMSNAYKELDDTKLSLTTLKHHAAVRILNTSNEGKLYYWYAFTWRGNASIKRHGKYIVLRCKGDNTTIEGKKKKVYSLDITLTKIWAMPSDNFFNYTKITPFTDYAVRASSGWNNFWNETGIADFSGEESPDAQLVERKLVENLYNITATTPEDWWLQAPLTAYGFAKQIVPEFRRIIRQHPEQLWQRPELIAASLLTLRAYTLPQVAERFMLTDEEVQILRTTVLNALNLHVAKAAGQITSGQAMVPACLSREALLDVATWWQSAADSPDPQVSTTDSAKVNVDTLAKRDLELQTPLFLLPQAAELAALPTLTPQQQSLFLFAVANRQWPAAWKVKTENLLPLP